MYAMRRWSVRNARPLERLYRLVARVLGALEPLWRRLGYERADGPVAAVERGLKGFLFDCRMCGRCMLTHSGMSCPMNCPKSMRNGPCGGVRADGGCEVEPAMRCVWLEAWEGSRRMREGDAILALQGPLDHALEGTSAWLRVVREEAGP